MRDQPLCFVFIERRKELRDRTFITRVLVFITDWRFSKRQQPKLNKTLNGDRATRTSLIVRYMYSRLTRKDVRRVKRHRYEVWRVNRRLSEFFVGLLEARNEREAARIAATVYPFRVNLYWHSQLPMIITSSVGTSNFFRGGLTNDASKR